MKLSRIAVGILGAGLLFSTSAFAQENKGKLSLPETVTVEGKQLAPGDYKVQWDGAGPNVEVKILKGKDTVATVPARVVAEPTKTQVDSFGVTNQQDGSHALTAIYFGGKTISLELGQAAAQTTPTTDAGSR
jgi:hypothetical protein